MIAIDGIRIKLKTSYKLKEPYRFVEFKQGDQYHEHNWNIEIVF